jgi:hypothetical protein
MFKIISLLFLLLSFVKATDVALTSQNIRSYPLSKNKAAIKACYSGYDIFNLNDNKNGTATYYGTLGDINGINITLGYGLYEQISLFYDFLYKNIDYAGGSLKNNKHEIFTKLNIYYNPSSIFNTYSADIGFIHNSADDLSITDSSTEISKITDLSDDSLYLRFIVGSKIRSSILDFYFGLKYTSIDTKIDAISYDRDEIALNGGFEYTLELGNYIIESGYEYIRLFSRDIDDDESSNHIFNITLSRALNQKVLLYIGSKYFINQYNGVIPYLYNEKNKNQFDQKFGYLTIGFVYNFDMNGLNN